MSEGQFKWIADEYVREYGAQLRRELEGIEQRPILLSAPSLDHRVRRGTTGVKRVRYMRYAGVIAACVVIALLTPLALRLFPIRVAEQAPGLNPSSPTAPPSDVYTEQTPDSHAPAPAEPPSDVHVEPPNVGSAYEVLPLSFDIPGQFNIASVEQDVEKTIYHLNDNKLDDVVITLERSGDISRFDTLTELSIGGYNALGSSGNGYNLLAFRDESSDILYILTCKYDINTLVLLSESILI